MIQIYLGDLLLFFIWHHIPRQQQVVLMRSRAGTTHPTFGIPHLYCPSISARSFHPFYHPVRQLLTDTAAVDPIKTCWCLFS